MPRKVVELVVVLGLSSIFKLSVGSMENFQLNIDDILNERLMPASLLWQPDILHDVDDVNKTPSIQADGDFGKAYSMMGYHRKMMNEFLCSSFIAHQIMTEFAPNFTSTISRRLGSPADDQVTEIAPSNISSITRQAKMIPNEELLYDSGSSGYRNWLAKTTTLDDIQRQFAGNHLESGLNGTNRRGQMTRKPGLDRRLSSYSVDEAADDEYEEGDVTGYAVQQPVPMPEYLPELLPGKNDFPDRPVQFPSPYPTAGSKNGYFPSGHDGYGENYAVQGYDYGATSQSKELGLKDFMEIALTTLAFLSFGMFLLQVLMCITMNKSDNNLMMMPMEVPEGGGSSEVEEIRRKKRSLINDRIRKVNEISRRVLLSIDTAIYAYEDEGQCLHRVLCDNNNFARKQPDGQKIWMPVWSLGLSWLSARMVPPKIANTAALSSLKATAMGLGGANCEKLYSTCDLVNLAEKKKREKRDVKTKFEWSL